MPTKAVYTGGCLCGSIRYSVIGNPVLLIICYRRFCQRATGSSHLVEPIWRERDFVLDLGEPQTFAATSPGSGKRVTLSFCGACGTKLYQTMERFSGVIGFYGGTLDDPDVVRTARETWRMFLDDAAAGTVIPPGVEVWAKHRLSADGQPLDSVLFDEMHIVRGIA